MVNLEIVSPMLAIPDTSHLPQTRGHISLPLEFGLRQPFISLLGTALEGSLGFQEMGVHLGL